MYQTYSLTRAFDADDMRVQTFTVSDDDAVNCAHMLAAGFNTMSRNLMHTYVLAVVDTRDGRVFYDGKIETIKRDKPGFSEQTFTFNPTAGDADTILTLFGKGETPTFTAAGNLSFSEPDEPKTTAEFAKRVKREVLEAAYVELDAVKNVLFEAGCETIPADAGVRDLADMHLEKSKTIEQRDVEIAEFRQREVTRTAAARDELIEFTRGAYEKLRKVDPEGGREDLQNRYRGMLDVLANLLVAIGEADRDERHAVARRLVEFPED